MKHTARLIGETHLFVMASDEMSSFPRVRAFIQNSKKREIPGPPGGCTGGNLFTIHYLLFVVYDTRFDQGAGESV